MRQAVLKRHIDVTLHVGGVTMVEKRFGRNFGYDVLIRGIVVGGDDVTYGSRIRQLVFAFGYRS